MDSGITLIQWFLIILAADLAAAFTFQFVMAINWKKILKKKRKAKRARKLAAVIPFEKRDKES